MKSLPRICLIQLSQKLTGQKASMGPVSGEPGATLKRAKSQRMEKKLSHACRQMRRKQSLSILYQHPSPVASKRQQTTRKNHDTLENPGKILRRKKIRRASGQKENTNPGIMITQRYFSTASTKNKCKGQSTYCRNKSYLISISRKEMFYMPRTPLASSLLTMRNIIA